MFAFMIRPNLTVPKLRYQTVTLLVVVVVMLFIFNIGLILSIQRLSRDSTLVQQDTYTRVDINKLAGSGEVLRTRKEMQYSEVEEGVIQQLSSNRAGEDSYWIPMQDDAVDTLINKLKSQNNFFPAEFWTSSLAKLTRQLGALARQSADRLPFYEQIKASLSDSLPNWKLVHSRIRRYSLYDPDDKAFQGLLHDMRTLPIVKIDLGDRLLPCFDSLSDINLQSSKAHAPRWGPDSSTSEVSTIQLEFRDLSRATIDMSKCQEVLSWTEYAKKMPRTRDMVAEERHDHDITRNTVLRK